MNNIELKSEKKPSVHIHVAVLVGELAAAGALALLEITLVSAATHAHTALA